MLQMKADHMEFPADANIIVGQSHFIKTVEDLYEAVATTVPQAKFGLAFNESSGACLTRSEEPLSIGKPSQLVSDFSSHDLDRMVSSRSTPPLIFACRHASARKRRPKPIAT